MTRKLIHIVFIFLPSLLAILVACFHGPVSSTSGGDWNVTIWASNPCVQQGDTVHLRATVTNNRGTLEVIDLKDKPVFDIFIFRPGSPGSYAVHWSDRKPLTPDLTHIELEAGESKMIEMDWLAPSSGSYAVDAIFRDPKLGGYEIRSGVTINVGPCPGIGP